LLSSSQLNEPEKFYPLRQVWCRDCTLSQLDYVVPGSEVYYPDNPYRPGITKELVAYQEQFAKEVSKELSLQQGDHVVDIGSNDGTLLTGFKKQGMKVTGIEPTNVAKIAVDSGIETLQRFFDEAAAREIVDLNGQAKLVTATNVFAHMSTLGAFLRGLEVLLSDGGVFVLENHYLLDIMDGVQFDSIYHEHLRSYSLKSIGTLFDYYDFTVTDVKRVSRYGGNRRVYVTRGRGKTVKPSVGELLRKEEEAGLSRPEFYQNFKHKVDSAAFGLLKLAIDCKQKGKSFVGNSCPGRCSTLLNYAGIGRETMPYIAEQPTS
jgi:2-polyprenyl-3-methyl-5-hydroxy-6-metoxy-1,4-benzoquinol methylase